ncbi:MAG TPA: M50 family metallopeptidase [Alphaproteobacteria bacterium]|nr:M50 family metallopeptidase [Alphaproteobacteria bacterium]
MEMFQELLNKPVDFFMDYGGPFILVLSILVFVHEWGHYIVARMCGVKVDSFSIGFGRELFGWTDKQGCRWKFSLIPLGGYVQMFGDSDPASVRHEEGVEDAKGEKIREFTAEEKKVAFYAQPVGRRAAIVFAGPAVNYIFAIILLTGLYATQGQPYMPPVAAGVVEDSAAFEAGIRPGDMIVQVNDRKITSFNDLRKNAALNLNQEVTLTLRRALPGTAETGNLAWETETETMRLTPRLELETDRFGFRHETGRIGVVSLPSEGQEVREHSIASGLMAATKDAYYITIDTLEALKQMVLGIRSTDELGGILRIGAYAGDFAQQGIIAFITFAALLSVNLGLINLLPIPILDGGHLVMYAMEKARGKPLGEQVQEYALRVGLVFLVSIMFFATWNDLVQLKFVDYVKSLIS